MSEHTGGDWEVGGPHKNEISASHAPAFLIAFCPFGILGMDVAQANARLMAASKKLLEACQLARSYLTDDAARNDMSDGGFARYDDVCDALREAIAKATGEAQDADNTT